jgi:hypothetical protein
MMHKVALVLICADSASEGPTVQQPVCARQLARLGFETRLAVWL